MINHVNEPNQDQQKNCLAEPSQTADSYPRCEKLEHSMCSFLFKDKTDTFFLSEYSALSPFLLGTLGVSQPPLSLIDFDQSVLPCAIMLGRMVESNQWRRKMLDLAVS